MVDESAGGAAAVRKCEDRLVVPRSRLSGTLRASKGIRVGGLTMVAATRGCVRTALVPGGRREVVRP